MPSSFRAFQKNIEKYHKFLRDTVNSDESDDSSTHSNAENPKKSKCKFSMKKLVSVARKIQWEFTMKNEVQKLQNYLGLHVDAINTLLAVYGLETMELNTVANQESHDELKDLINSTQRTLDHVSSNLDSKALVVKNTSNMVEKLVRAVIQ
jgi:DNA-directed RNA polymerase sigma subunit (sigma70/sigma32)